MKKLDLRVRMTRMIIRETLLELLKTKELSDITVTDICTRGGINRSTFYNHYSDVYDLVEKLEEERLSELQSKIQEVMDSEKDYNIYNILKVTVREIRDNIKLYNLFWHGEDNKNFRQKMVDICYRDYMIEVEKQFPFLTDAEHKWIFNFMAAGSNEALKVWINNGMKEDPDELVNTVVAAMFGIFSSSGEAFWRLNG